MNLSTTEYTQDSVETRMMKAVHGAIQQEIENAITEELAGMADRVEMRVRGKIGDISARCFTHFAFERMGQDLVIRVAFDGAKKS